MDKKLLLLVSIIVISSIAHAEINMPSAPIYNAPSKPAYSAPQRTYKQPAHPNIPTVKTQQNTAAKSSDKSVYLSSNKIENKKEFYDNFIPELFNGMKKELISQGFTKYSVSMFMKELEPRFNRQELEDSTWECVSKYPIKDLLDKENNEKFIHTCFSDWTIKYVNKNYDLAQKYLRQ